ncbi:MAG: hypothetical protein IKA97_03180 [Clostridia bacterium]|nr:hypothetical protein [Clostridia bacterium]
MRKKGILFSSIVALLVLAILVGVFFLLFTVSDLSVYDKSGSSKWIGDIQEYANGYAKGVVFFFNKQSFANNLSKQFPYSKVENVEIIFPNKIEVTILERKALYAIEDGGTFYLFDKEGVLLESKSTNVGGDGNYACILVDKPQSAQQMDVNAAGTVPAISTTKEMKMVLNFLDLMSRLEYDYSENELKGMLYSVSIENNNTLRAKTRFGTEFCIYDFDNDSANKVAYIMAAFTSGAVTDPNRILYVGDDLKVIAGLQ